MNDGLIFYDSRIYVPSDHVLRGEIIAHVHDHITAGHPGIEKTKELVLREYWWPKMKKDVKDYVRACETCQRTKIEHSSQSSAPFIQTPFPPDPWTHISVDMVTGLPRCNGQDAILMIVDRFSKEIIPIACTTELSSEGWGQNSTRRSLRQARNAPGRHL